jgi:hypothetical protein
MVNTETANQRYHRLMSEQPPKGPPLPSDTGGFPSSRGQFPSVAAAPPPWPLAPPRGQSRALTYAALAVALIATGLAVAGWFRPSPVAPTQRSASPTYTEQQILDAKQRACEAFEVVQKGAALQTNPTPSDDLAMSNAQAAHAQLSLVAGGWYLRDHLEPGTPPQISDELHKLANTMLDIGINALAGAKNADPSQAELIKTGNDAVDHTTELCK